MAEYYCSSCFVPTPSMKGQVSQRSAGRRRRRSLGGVSVSTTHMGPSLTFVSFNTNNHDRRYHVMSNHPTLSVLDRGSSISSSSSPSSSSTSLFMNMIPDSSPLSFGGGTTLLQSAVEVFDGSTIMDPVVVSTVFWSSLKAKILSVFVGQLLATAVFGLLAMFFSTQLITFSDYIRQRLDMVWKENNGDERRKMKMLDNSREFGNYPTSITPNVGKLVLCLLIDMLGTSSELIPLVGEITDVVYAPAAALTLRYLFQGSNVVFVLEFLEEFLPFTDILPLATICWVIETYFGDSPLAKTLQIGMYSNAPITSGNSSSSSTVGVTNNCSQGSVEETTKVVDAEIVGVMKPNIKNGSRVESEIHGSLRKRDGME